MAPVYQLKFFDFMGFAEPIRYLLAYGGINYESVVVNKDANWPAVQKSVPFGKLPVLEVDKKVLYQSVAISQYLGKKVGLVPDDDLEAAELDAIALSVYDLANKVYEWYHEVNKETKANLEKELKDVWFSNYLRDFESIVRKKGKFFGGQNVSWADLYFVGIVEWLEGLWGYRLLVIIKYPLLERIYRLVHAIPAIETYISTRSMKVE